MRRRPSADQAQINPRLCPSVLQTMQPLLQQSEKSSKGPLLAGIQKSGPSTAPKQSLCRFHTGPVRLSQRKSTPRGALCADQAQTKRRPSAHEAQTKRRPSKDHAASASVVTTNSCTWSFTDDIRKAQKSRVHGNPIVNAKQGQYRFHRGKAPPGSPLRRPSADQAQINRT